MGEDDDLLVEYVAWGAAVIALLILLAIALTDCAGKPVDYERGALQDQILRPLPGHTGLVNSQCTHLDDGSCKWDRIDYDLNDKATRVRLRDAGFVCLVSGRAYRIALNSPGLIYETYDHPLFGAAKERVLSYIPIENVQSLIDQGTECYSIYTFKYFEEGSSCVDGSERFSRRFLISVLVQGRLRLRSPLPGAPRASGG